MKNRKGGSSWGDTKAKIEKPSQFSAFLNGSFDLPVSFEGVAMRASLAADSTLLAGGACLAKDTTP